MNSAAYCSYKLENWDASHEMNEIDEEVVAIAENSSEAEVVEMMENSSEAEAGAEEVEEKEGK